MMSHESFVHGSVPEAPTDRNFGWVFSGVFAICALLACFSKLPGFLSFGFLAEFFFALGLPALARYAPALAMAVVSLAFLILALFVPGMLAPLNRLWTRFGALLHRIVSPVVLGLMFFVIFTPTGWVMRLFRRDPLRLRFDRTLSSYWIDRVPPGPEPESLKNQF